MTAGVAALVAHPKAAQAVLPGAGAKVGLLTAAVPAVEALAVRPTRDPLA